MKFDTKCFILYKKHNAMASKAFKRLFSLFVFSCLLMNNLFAQGSDPVPPGAEAEIPIDGGILGLLAAGAVYGAKKIYDRRKK
jgi:hypothetical protein